MKYVITTLILIVLIFHSFLCASSSRAEERILNENQAKAAFIFNVARYVSWPPPHSDTLLIGVLGKHPLAHEWQGISGKTLNGRKIKIFKSNDVDELIDCQIVFIEETSQQKTSRALLFLRRYPILTIGDSPDFINMGGILNISLFNNHISFSISQAQTRAVGLDISSNLLKLAKEVIK